jgi:hypothetical protein
MKNNDATKPTLALRAHSIRNLTAAELRVAHGGCGFGSCETGSEEPTRTR